MNSFDYTGQYSKSTPLYGKWFPCTLKELILNCLIYLLRGMDGTRRNMPVRSILEDFSYFKCIHPWEELTPLGTFKNDTSFIKALKFY